MEPLLYSHYIVHKHLLDNEKVKAKLRFHCHANHANTGKIIVSQIL